VALGWAELLQKGRTALHFAAWNGHAGVVSALIEGKAALDVPDEVSDVRLFARSLFGRRMRSARNNPNNPKPTSSVGIVIAVTTTILTVVLIGLVILLVLLIVSSSSGSSSASSSGSSSASSSSSSSGSGIGSDERKQRHRQ
jgi:hypothetical protein